VTTALRLIFSARRNFSDAASTSFSQDQRGELHSGGVYRPALDLTPHRAVRSGDQRLNDTRVHLSLVTSS